MGSPLDEVLEALQALVDARAETPVPREAGEGNFRCERCTDCSHCRFCEDCNACEDCTYCERCDGCSACTHCKDCARCRDTTHSRWSAGCSDSSYLTLCLDCEGCVQCFACVGMSGAEFCVLNEKLPRKAYFSRVAALRGALEERAAAGWIPPWGTEEPEEPEEAEPEDLAPFEEPEPDERHPSREIEEPELDDDELSVEIPAASLHDPARSSSLRPGRADVTVDTGERAVAARRTQPTPWTFGDLERERVDVREAPPTRELPEPPPYGSTGSFEAIEPDPPRGVERSRDRYGWSAQTEGTPVHLDWPALEDRAGEPDELARRPWTREPTPGRDEPDGRGRPWASETSGRSDFEARRHDRVDPRAERDEPRRRPWTSEPDDGAHRRPWPDRPEDSARSPWGDRPEPARERWAEPPEEPARGRWEGDSARRRWAEEPPHARRRALDERPSWDEEAREDLQGRRDRDGLRREPERMPDLDARIEQHSTFEWPRAERDRPEADDLDWRRRETAVSPRARSSELESMADLETPSSDRLAPIDVWSPHDERQRSKLGPDDQTEPDAPVTRRGRSRAEVSDVARMPEPSSADDWGEAEPAPPPETGRPGLGSGRRPERPRADTPRTGLMRGRAPARPAPPTPRQADAPSLRRARRPARGRDEVPTAPYPSGDGEDG